MDKFDTFTVIVYDANGTIIHKHKHATLQMALFDKLMAEYDGGSWDIFRDGE